MCTRSLRTEWRVLLLGWAAKCSRETNIWLILEDRSHVWLRIVVNGLNQVSGGRTAWSMIDWSLVGRIVSATGSMIHWSLVVRIGSAQHYLSINLISIFHCIICVYLWADLATCPPKNDHLEMLEFRTCSAP